MKITHIKHLLTRLIVRPSFLPILILIIMPILANLPVLFGLVDSNPIGIYSGLSTDVKPGLLPGISSTDNNVGYTTQALGHRAALDWLNGSIPWWNPYEGVGLPLAGEMQAAALFPFTMLLYFSNGLIFSHILLEIIAGISTYLLLRKLMVSQWSAVIGGIMFELNGSFSWFGHAPFNPIAFLPLLLLGIERAFQSAKQHKKNGRISLLSIHNYLDFGAVIPRVFSQRDFSSAVL